MSLRRFLSKIFVDYLNETMPNFTIMLIIVYTRRFSISKLDF